MHACLNLHAPAVVCVDEERRDYDFIGKLEGPFELAICTHPMTLDALGQHILVARSTAQPQQAQIFYSQVLATSLGDRGTRTTAQRPL